VFVIDGNTVKEREVKIGERSENGVEIVEGLKTGERIAVANKGQELKEGAIIETGS
jgi:multidrug efflux pump subunit AcrA (membrane-fusion protein)